MNLLLDTNILVYISTGENRNRIIDFIAADADNLFSSVAEIISLALRNKSGVLRPGN
jgi:hypothetical protein